MKKKGTAVLLLLCMLLSFPGAAVLAESTPSSDATLSSLSVDTGTLSGFSSGTTTYDLGTTDASSITITAAATDAGATITGAGPRDLGYGANALNVTVKAADNTTTMTYTLNITRNDTRSADASLSSLTVGGTAVTGFSATTYSYNVTLASTVTSTEIAATATNSKAKVSGTGTKTLAYGTNTSKIVVTAEKGNTQVYTVVVTRTDSRSSDSTLSALTVSDANFTFNKSTTSYTVSVASTIESVKIAATANNSKATVTGTGTKTLTYGTNTFKIVVTAENETTTTYTVNVSRPDTRSVNNYLSTLTVAGAPFDFVQTTTDYTVIVPNATKSVEIAATAADTTSKITGIGSKDLSVYSNTVSVVVTAENGETRTYKLKIIRRDEKGHVSSSESELHRLTALSIEGVDDFAFDPDTYEYDIDVDNAITQLNFTATTEDSGDTWSAQAVSLAVGENTVVVSVLDNGALVNSYTFTATRDEAYVTFDSFARKLAKATGDSITVEIHDDNNVMTADLLNLLKTSGKSVEIVKYDASGKELYSWSFSGAGMTGTPADLNTLINFSSLHKDQIDALTHDKGCVYLDFSYSGTLPAQTTIKLYVGDKYQDGDTAYVYFYNSDTNKLELVAEKLTVSGGYISFTTDHCSEYIVTNYKTGMGSLLLILIVAGVLLIAGATIFLLAKKGVLDLGGSGRRSSRSRRRRKSASRRR